MLDGLWYCFSRLKNIQFYILHVYYLLFNCSQRNQFLLYSIATSGKLPVESSSVDVAILIWQSLDSPVDQLVQEILRVLKAGGTTLIRKSSQSGVGSVDKVMAA